MSVMDHDKDESSLIERIRSTGTARVFILRGPAASGKTAAVKQLYQNMLDRDGGSACMLLVPNFAATEAMRLELLAASPSGVLSQDRVLTFAVLVGRILAADGDPGRAMTAFERRILLRRIINSPDGRRRLGPLAAVADTPGIVTSLDRCIAELKRAAVEPEQLAKAIFSADARSRGLLEVYRLYQRRLHESGAYDLQGRAWRARDILARRADPARPGPGLEGVRAVAADGFTDFTPTQLDMLALLAERLEAVVITLPHADDGRDRLWQWTGRTLERMRSAFSRVGVEVIDTSPRPGPIRVVWDNLFAFDRPAAGDLPPAVEIIAAAGPDKEIAAVAGRVKKLLLSAGQSGPGRIAVLARSISAYRPMIERTFAACGIPVASAPQPLSEVPVVRFLLAAAGISPQFASRDVLKVIGNSYFSPASLGPYDEGELAAAEAIIRRGNVLAGREAYRRAGERLAAAVDDSQADGDDSDSPPAATALSGRVLASACDMIEALFDLAAGIVDADGLAGLIDALDLRRVVCDSQRDELIARDLAALDKLTASLRSAPARDAPLGEVVEALSAVTVPPARGESLVEVLDVLDARPLRFDHVFLVGMSEGQFPQKFTDSSIIRQSDREAWRPAGVQLDSRGDLAAREMLLFYLAASRAEKTLTLSFQDSGPSGKSSQAGPFLLAVVDPFGGLDRAESAGLVEHVSPGDLVPPADRIASPNDALIAAVAGLFNADRPEAPAAAGWVAANRRELLVRIARGLWASYRRHKPGPCDRFDGRITDPALLRDLAEEFPGQTVFSAGTLNAFGQCPWRFFASELLAIAPLAVVDQRLDAVSRGLFAHDVLFRTMTDLMSRAGGPVRLASLDPQELDDALDRAIAAAARRVEARSPAYPILWQIQKQRMQKQLRNYLHRQRDRAGDIAVIHCELAFGLHRSDPASVDPSSSPDPVGIETPAGTVRLSGKIDRVDRLDELDERDGALLVVDYKTGRVPAAKDIAAGRDLQLQIYIEAIEKLTGGGRCLGGVFHRVLGGERGGERGSERGSERGGERHFSELKPPRGEQRDFDQRRLDARRTIGRFVEAMANGRFDVYPAEHCAKFCPYRQICRYSPARAQIKTPPASQDGDGGREAAK